MNTVIKRPEGQYDFDSICNMTVRMKMFENYVTDRRKCN